MQNSARISLISAASMIYSQILSAFFGTYLAAKLGPDGYGLFNLARNFFNIAIVLSPLGLDIGLQKHFGALSMSDERNRELMVLRIGAFMLAGVVGLVTIVSSGTLETSVFHHTGFARILILTMLALPFATDMAVLSGAYRGIYNPIPSLVTIYFLQPTCRLILIVGLLFWTDGLTAVIYGTLISYIAIWGISALWAARHFRMQLSKPLLSALGPAKEVVKYSVVMGIAYFALTLARSTDTMMLAYFAPIDDVGRYAIVQMIGQLVALIGVSLGQTLLARVAAAAVSGQPCELHSILHDNMRIAAILSSPLCVGIALWGKDIDLILGPNYSVAASVFAVAAIGQWMMTVTHYSSAGLAMCGRHRVELWNNIGALVVQILACAVLVPYFGMIGAAASTAVMLVVINTIRQIQLTALTGRLIFNLSILTPLAASAVAAVPVYWLYSLISERRWWITGITGISYLVVAFALVVLVVATRDERRRMFEIILRRNKTAVDN